MPRFLMTLMYDGSAFHGWQKQCAQRSVQQDLETALGMFSTGSTQITASGRTDAGVHAMAQRAHFDYDGSMTPPLLLRAFRRYLEDDVKVLEIVSVPDDFHARYDAYQRSYVYLLTSDRTPFNRNYKGYIPHKRFEVESMRAGAKYLLGAHDFSSFGKHNPAVPNRICEVKDIKILTHREDIVFLIRADRFLHNMVRRIVGTLVDLSHCGLPPSIIGDILAEANPKQKLGMPAPAEGLYLIEVKYPPIDS
ncbi:MAG: tRNA pseudouridine(38-40) synthase TruA [Candidatus Cloacimonadaceae bacterium]|nr:tRNA pseudouridine(38-40) synthase TruA [Candidatus Cloacimonadaceae bacterium]